MSLAIAFKGHSGIVLATDSRVTLTAEAVNAAHPEKPNLLLSSTFDNARKLLKVNGQDYVAAVTYGMGVIGQKVPRTAYSFLPEFEAGLKTSERLSVEEFAQKLSDFFMVQWKTHMDDYSGEDEMVFLVGGFDKDAAYGRIFEVGIPQRHKPKEWHAQPDEFGPVWGGERAFIELLINGFDPSLLNIAKNELGLSDEQYAKLKKALRQLIVPIPFQFLPLQDCVDLSIFLIRTTMTILNWQVGIRGVGGAIDVAIITRTEGFQQIQQKRFKGEPAHEDRDLRGL